jgi:RNA polymerase sigma factor (sigma-70 family)
MNSVVIDGTGFIGNRDRYNVGELGREVIEASPSAGVDMLEQTEKPDINDGGKDSAFEIFVAYRPLLFGIAYRMLGEISEVEDMIHEVWLRWRNQNTSRVRSPKAWLGCAMRRFCIDQLRSARRQREHQYGLVSPEPSITLDDWHCPEEENSLAVAFAILLRTLRPMERAVFMLREAFGYGCSETAAIIGKSEANCRQIACRAKTRLGKSTGPQAQPDLRAHQLAEEFLSAAATGQLVRFLKLLEDTSSNRASANARGNYGGQANTNCPLWPMRIVFPIQPFPRRSCAFATTAHWTGALRDLNQLASYRHQPMHEDRA